MFNRVELIGRLGRDTELFVSQGAVAVATNSVATTEKWTNANGDPVERTEWHRIVVFGKFAEMAAKLYTKGKQVFVQGRLRTRKYEKNGETRYITEIIAQDMKLLGSAPAAAGLKEGDFPPPVFEDTDDMVPF